MLHFMVPRSNRTGPILNRQKLTDPTIIIGLKSRPKLFSYNSYLKGKSRKK